MSPGDVYNEIYAGLQGLSGSSNLIDYLGEAHSQHHLQQNRESMSHREQQMYENRGYNRSFDDHDDLGSYPSSLDYDSRPRFSVSPETVHQPRFSNQYNEDDDVRLIILFLT